MSGISIHALREEGDLSSAAPPPGRPAISIHALREEGDREIVVENSAEFVFLSTPSARRATILTISNYSDIVDFYPRPPRGGRHEVAQTVLPIISISIHALREEGDPAA